MLRTKGSDRTNHPFFQVRTVSFQGGSLQGHLQNCCLLTQVQTRGGQVTSRGYQAQSGWNCGIVGWWNVWWTGGLRKFQQTPGTYPGRPIVPYLYFCGIWGMFQGFVGVFVEVVFWFVFLTKVSLIWRKRCSGISKKMLQVCKWNMGMKPGRCWRSS